VSARVLVAEDDEKHAELVRRYLLRDGHELAVVHDGYAAIDHARRWRPDLLILDVMMPGPDGLQVCRTLRAESGLPVLMLTARSAEDDLLLGLDLGADDYLTKPYSPRELMARVRALLRRSRTVPAAMAASTRIFRVGALAVDPGRHEVRMDGRSVECTPGEFALLATLAGQPGRVFSRRQLLELTRGADHYITERTVDVHMMNLRKKLEPEPARPAYLLTVYGVGYKLSEAPGAGRAP
jgi:two-component system, OmpR family, alkaline phosphatase synthesis response regulator PhoP